MGKISIKEIEGLFKSLHEEPAPDTVEGVTQRVLDEVKEKYGAEGSKQGVEPEDAEPKPVA